MAAALFVQSKCCWTKELTPTAETCWATRQCILVGTFLLSPTMGSMLSYKPRLPSHKLSVPLPCGTALKLGSAQWCEADSCILVNDACSVTWMLHSTVAAVCRHQWICAITYPDSETSQSWPKGPSVFHSLAMHFSFSFWGKHGIHSSGLCGRKLTVMLWLAKAAWSTSEPCVCFAGSSALALLIFHLFKHFTYWTLKLIWVAGCMINHTPGFDL